MEYVYPVCWIFLGAVVLALPFFRESAAEVEVKIVLAAVGLLLIGWGIYGVRRHSREDLTTPVYTVDDIPLEQRSPYIIRALVIFLVVSIPASAFLAYQLAGVEYGGEEGVTVWSPVALVYNNFGFWPAVLMLPVFILLILALNIKKLREVKALQSVLRIFD